MGFFRRLFCWHLNWRFEGYGNPGWNWHQCAACGKRKEFPVHRPPINYVPR